MERPFGCKEMTPASGAKIGWVLFVQIAGVFKRLDAEKPVQYQMTKK